MFLTLRIVIVRGGKPLNKSCQPHSAILSHALEAYRTEIIDGGYDKPLSHTRHARRQGAVGIRLWDRAGTMARLAMGGVCMVAYHMFAHQTSSAECVKQSGTSTTKPLV